MYDGVVWDTPPTYASAHESCLSAKEVPTYVRDRLSGASHTGTILRDTLLGCVIFVFCNGWFSQQTMDPIQSMCTSSQTISLFISLPLFLLLFVTHSEEVRLFRPDALNGGLRVIYICVNVLLTKK